MRQLTLLIIFLIIQNSLSQNQNYIHNGGTLWYKGYYNILNDSDISVYESLKFEEEAIALMWDRTAEEGKGAWLKPISWIFEISYLDNVTAKVRVRKSDFSKQKAFNVANKYAYYLGKLPYVLRKGIKLINIMKVEANFGGNNWNNSIDIYEASLSERIINEGNIEEMLLHEGAHAALDYLYKKDWNNERNKDLKYISKYAFDNPNREDISETFAIWLALKNNRLTEKDFYIITKNLKHRINYLNSLNFNLYPIKN